MDITFQAILTAVGSVGFPIVITWYLLTKMRDTIDKNTVSNEKISIILAKICEKLNIPE